MEAPRKTFWDQFGLPDLGNYTPVPLYFFDELMQLGKTIPPSFWQFLFVVWRDIIRPGKKRPDGSFEHSYLSKHTQKQWSQEHSLSGKAAGDWTVACQASGLFGVQWGRRHVKDQPGVPTVLRYRKESTTDDWKAFIVGLSNACRTMKSWNMARRGQARESGQSLTQPRYDGQAAYELLVAVEVDRARIKFGLQPVNTEQIDFLIKQGAGERAADGCICYHYVTSSRSGVLNAKMKEYVYGE